MYFLNLQFCGSKLIYKCTSDHIVTASELVDFVSSIKGFPADDLKLVQNNCYVKDDDVISNGSTVYVVLSLPGGKGGFGSMLRAIGAQIEKTTNREACRDLSGRRLRDINEESRLKQWISKQADREREAADRKKSRLERLKTLPKHDFHDPNYDRERSEMPERIDDALTEGLKKSSTNSHGVKRKSNSSEVTSRKKASNWFGDLDDIDSNEGSSSSETEDSVPKSDAGGASEERIAQIMPMPLSMKSNTEDKKSTVPEILDLTSFESISELEALGLDRLKSALMALGMKCGGTLQQRAERLWAVRGIEPKKIDPNLLAKQA